MEAPDAERFGLINYAVPDEELNAKVEEFAQKLAAGPTRVMGNIKWAAYQGLEVPFNQAVLLASAFQGEGGRTEDRIEGGKSFSEKREAAYTGRDSKGCCTESVSGRYRGEHRSGADHRVRYPRGGSSGARFNETVATSCLLD